MNNNQFFTTTIYNPTPILNGLYFIKINHVRKILNKAKKIRRFTSLSGLHNKISNSKSSSNPQSAEGRISGGFDFVDTDSKLTALKIYVINNYTVETVCTNNDII